MDHIEIEYNQNLKLLETILAKVKRPGDFFIHGAFEMPMPKVVVEGAETLSFPAPDVQIAAIVAGGTAHLKATKDSPSGLY